MLTEIEDSIRPKYLISLKKFPHKAPKTPSYLAVCPSRLASNECRLTNLKEKDEIDHIERGYVLLDDKRMLHV